LTAIIKSKQLLVNSSHLGSFAPSCVAEATARALASTASRLTSSDAKGGPLYLNAAFFGCNFSSSQSANYCASKQRAFCALGDKPNMASS